MQSPFIANETALIVKEFTGKTIKNNWLREQVNDFYYKHYVPATIFLERKNSGRHSSKWWPGHEDVKGKYSVKTSPLGVRDSNFPFISR
jgi:hypothetical protein